MALKERKPYFVGDKEIEVISSGKKFPMNISGYARREEVYALQFRQSYRFHGNIPNERAEGFAKRCEKQGLDVFVGDRAFLPNGSEDSKMKTILVRPEDIDKKEQERKE